MQGDDTPITGPLTDDSPVVQLFKALAHPMRASIIYRLAESPADVSELVELLGVSQPLVSHHLRLLREAHLVEAVRDGRRNLYSLIDDHVASIFLDALGHMKEHDHDCHH
ncbi:metalloregulator ArsR/SmtB family transcription factor [Actinomyces bowdenii]|uniref:ArsR/SmtB family transcription factor n=1 Tax=Actinomyces bowdenii TaxID=131109 RepID=UPI00214D07E5|nr:metalloregulator ArsR/SmtB family transcription factor [Actinomyces bowdenii]MCR2052259.1 metalloregulator ArsR/SmtB family transcription factor [Actinomyces bowdenii]